MALKISQLERYTNRQQEAINDVIDKVQDNTSVCSRSDKSTPGVIDINGTSTTDSSELSTAQVLIASLTVSLADAERNRHVPRRDRPGLGRGGGHSGLAGRGVKGGERRPQGVLGPVNENADRRLTQKDGGRTEKKCKNKLYYHTHGYEFTNGHDSAHCKYPEKGHKPCAMAENLMRGCLLYKQLLHCP